MRWTALAAGVLLVGSALCGGPAEAARHHPRTVNAQPAGESDLHYLVSHFRVLSPTAQVAVVQAMRDFMSAWEYANSKSYADASPELRERMSELARRWASLFGEDAWADGGFDCLFGGWPSKQSGGKCNSPARVNPTYQKLFKAAGCEKGGFLCAPALFGMKLCLEAKQQIAYNSNQTVNNEKTSDLIRSTYQSCKSAASKRKLEDIVKDIAEDPDTYSTLEQTEQAMASACFNQAHFQFGSDMCQSAKVRLAGVKKEFLKQFR